MLPEQELLPCLLIGMIGTIIPGRVRRTLENGIYLDAVIAIPLCYEGHSKQEV